MPFHDHRAAGVNLKALAETTAQVAKERPDFICYPEVCTSIAGGFEKGIATAPELESATSTAFDILPAEPVRLVFSAQPSDATAGELLAPAVQLQLLDAFDNQTTSTDDVTVALGTKPKMWRGVPRWARSTAIWT